MTVAIVHDYVTQRGGAERVVLSMLKAFPGATLHTSLYCQDQTFPEFADADVRTLSLDRIGTLRRHHRLALPLLAPAFSRHRVDADVVLCSSSGWAHGVATTGRKIVYCHSPARWLYQSDRYLRNSRSSVGASLHLLKRPLLRWDQQAARSAHRYLTNSEVVRRRVSDAYGIDAQVLSPPHIVDVDGTRREVAGVEPGSLLVVSRLMAYKNVDKVVDAFAELPDRRLVVVGVGPERERLEAMAGRNVSFAGLVEDAELRWLYATCAGIVSASHEDYGLTPIEAAAFGKPAVVLRWGGYEETVIEPDTGIFFDVPSREAVADGIRRLQARAWDASALRAHAATFGEATFIRRLRAVVADEERASEGASTLGAPSDET
jgi:glycosyltransferase involved in cell wall biosynthesis